MRDEGMTLPPDLLLIFKALITLDGVLLAIQPDFDLGQAMRRSSRRIAKGRIAPEHWAPVLQALAWELSKVGDDAPRLLRAAIRRLEAAPAGAASGEQAAATLSGMRCIAGAILAGAVLVAGAVLIS